MEARLCARTQDRPGSVLSSFSGQLELLPYRLKARLSPQGVEQPGGHEEAESLEASADALLQEVQGLLVASEVGPRSGPEERGDGRRFARATRRNPAGDRGRADPVTSLREE